MFAALSIVNPSEILLARASWANNPAFCSQFAFTISNFCIAWAAEAINGYSSQLNIYNGQFVNCQDGINWQYGEAYLRNTLFANVQLDFDSNDGATYAQNATFSGSSSLATSSSGFTLTFTNCILANVTHLTYSSSVFISGDYNGFYNCQELGTDTVTNTFYPFQTAGADNYYLTNGSPFRDVGTANIDPTLLAQLRQKTTWPPQVYTPQTISSDFALSPQAPHDTESPGPDLGYHYDPIDYALSGVVVTNATMTVSPGTVIATYGTNSSDFGLSIGTGGQLICDGTAVNLNRIITYNTVQEQGTNSGWQTPGLGSVTDYVGGAGGTFDFRFTDWSLIGQYIISHLIIYESNPVNLRDCQFHGGSVVTYLGPTINLTNCLFERVYLALYPDDGNTPVLRNNLFYGGTLDLYPFVTYYSVVQDNLFDRATIINNSSSCTYTGYNAYVTNCNRLQPTTTSDLILTGSPAYQTGPLGNYYEPASSPLIDAGSESVDAAGLTGYTILTNQTPDTGTVDMGYHYSPFSPPTACTSTDTDCPNTPYALCGSDNYSLPLTYITVTPPTHGTLGYNSSGQYVYTPNACYEGLDSFAYKVNDGFADSSTATVTLTTGDTVFASSLTPQTCRNTPVEITLSGNDSCGEDPLTFSYAVLVSPTNGVLSGAAPNLTYSNTSPTFTGMDSFIFKVTTPCGNSATGMVSVIIGDQNISANIQTAMTGTNEPLNLTLTASSVCTNAFAYTTTTPNHGTLSGGTGANRTYTPNPNYEGLDSFTFNVSDGVWTSSSPATVTIFIVAGPTNLTAQCVSDGPGVVLNWGLDAFVQDMEADDGLTIAGFEIYRRTSPGAFTTNDIIFIGSDATQTNYLDLTVIPGTTNYYAVAFNYQDPYTGIIYFSPYSNEATNIACFPPTLGTNGMDVAFIVDNTGSMGDVIEAIQDAIDNTLDYIVASSGGNYRLALVTPDLDNDGWDGNEHDMVDVRISFSETNRINFESAVNALFAYGGGNIPESTDQCLNTVVNALVASTRTNDDGCMPASPLLQTNNFSPAFRTNAVKLVVLITDAPPSGFCDSYPPTTIQAHEYALEASTNHIQINAIQISDDSDATPIMQDYSTTSCGWYEQLDYSSSSSDIETAILNMIYIPDECQ